MEGNKLLEILNRKKVRKEWFRDEWWYVIKDVIYVITKTVDTKSYLKDVRRNNYKIRRSWRKIALPVGIKTKKYNAVMNCSNLEGIIKIIKVIPSPNAKSIKTWIEKSGL
jgi:DNA-damage-inducible protein D